MKASKVPLPPPPLPLPQTHKEVDYTLHMFLCMSSWPAIKIFPHKCFEGFVFDQPLGT